MHLAYVCADRGVCIGGFNGAATHVRELTNAFVARGASGTILSPGARGGPDVACDVIDIDEDPLLAVLRRLAAKDATSGELARTQASEVHGLLLNGPLLEHLERLHAARPVDVVYERHSLWSLAGLQFARRHGLPFLLEVNAPLAAQQEEYRSLANAAPARGLEQMLLRNADRVLVPSRTLGDYVAAQGCRRRALRVVPCGVPREFLSRSRVDDRKDGEFVVGFLGSLKPWHGLDILMLAFRELLQRWDGYRLVVVGDGPMRARLEQFRDSMPITRAAVEIVGAVPYHEVPGHLARMDVGIAPYPPLPMFYFSPLKIFEYAAAGLPIVASGCGQIAEVLTHRSNALLHPPGSVRKIVKHVELLRTQPNLGSRLGRRARQVVAKRYTWDRLAARLLTMGERARREVAAGSG